MKSEASYAKWVGQAPVLGSLRTLLAIVVATAVGAVSGFAVVSSLLSAPTGEPQSLTRKIEAANSAGRQEEPQSTPGPEFNRSTVPPYADNGAAGIASQDANSTVSRSQPLPIRAADDQPPLIPGETKSIETVTSTSDAMEQQGQTQFDRGQHHFLVHHRRVYSRRFANTFLNLPLPRRW
jgi:hypothetical protein